MPAASNADALKPAMVFEPVPCLLCGGDNARPILKRHRPRHVICRDCGLVYENPRPTVESMAAHYRHSYWETKPPVGAADGRLEDGLVERGRAVLTMIGRPLTAADIVLEIGCGHGEVLQTIRQESRAQCIGIEPSVGQAETARNRFGLEIITGDAHSADLAGRRAAVIVLSHVAEHFFDPVAELAACRRHLADDGLLFVEVPNVMAPSRFKRLSSWLLVEHNYYYSAQSLSVVLRRAGFAPASVSDRGALRVLAKKSEPVPDCRAERNEFRRVRRALMLHEMAYWPGRLARRLTERSAPAQSSAAAERD